MNLAEFNALKPGDRIENAMSGSTGEVVEADTKGVRVQWGCACCESTTARHYSRFSTIWFHWSKVEPCVSDPENCACETVTHTLTADEVADVRRGGPHEVG